MTFKVIDKTTGKEPTDRVIYNLAKKGGLMTMDIDQFFVGEDGELILLDDCGNATYPDPKRFSVVFDSSDRWIPYSKAPRVFNKQWLCQDKDGNMAVGTYTSFGWCFGHYFGIPVAYMPLPVKYEEE